MKPRYILLPAVLVLLIGILLYRTAISSQSEARRQIPVRSVAEWSYVLEDGESGTISLPHKFDKLPPGSAVTLTTTVRVASDDKLLIKSVYTPFRVYADGALIYVSGQPENYPSFFPDPPTLLNTVELPESPEPVRLRIEYRSPTQRNEMMLPMVFQGSEAAIYAPLFHQSGLSFLLAILTLFVGICMIAASLLMVQQEKVTAAFLWLGLFALAAGCWSFGECNITVILLPWPTLLYLMAFLGLFCLEIPLLRFGLLVLDLRKQWPIRGIMALLEISVIVATILQLSGTVSFARSMYFFHVLIPSSLLLFSVHIIWEALCYQNRTARSFAIPMAVLALAGLLELLNYQMRFTNALSIFFQTGVLIFIFMLGVLGVRFILRSLREKAERTQLEFRLELMENQAKVQRTQYDILTEHAKLLREQRHDLRHQLIVIRQYNDAGDRESLDHYIGELTSHIPVEKDMRLCDNFAVNAVAIYYQALAKKNKIDISINLVIPKVNPHVQDSDLCLIIGNLLENAIEACAHLPEEQRFIRMRSLVQGGTLTIVMDNSFDGRYNKHKEVWISRKRVGQGTGLASIESTAQRYNGIVMLQPNGRIFQSSVYLQL